MTMPPMSTVSPTEWIRTVASRFAHRRPDICAEEVITLAIAHFKCSQALPPEIAAAQLVDLTKRQNPLRGG